MKLTKLFLFVALCSFASGFGQNITLSFENAQITNDGVDDFYEVDVFISSDTDYTQGSGQFLFNYNTAAFGENIQTNGNIEYIRPEISILGSKNFLTVENYGSFVPNDNVPSRTSFLWQQVWSAGIIGTNVTGTPALLLQIKIRFLDSSVSPDVCFDTTTPFDDQFFTACGPFGPAPATSDCFNEPGTQILDYSPDCTGGVISIGCAVKTWDGSTWTPAGAPTDTDNVVIAGDYNTTTDGGSITACELTVDATRTLTIAANDFLSVVNDITVNGTLNVAHTANVVQIDDAATVTNGGTINVFVDTPELDGLDFMLMGSPMSMETRDDVFSGALRVRNHLTGNFTPNASVMAASNGAGVWVDEEGDDWPVYMGSAINPGEGYMIMRDLTGPATALNLNFNTGTLNNGVTTYSAGYNGSQDASPSIIANPYASAMSAEDFINTNAGVVDAVYFWEHITPSSGGTPGPYGLNYTMEDISIFNLTGGTAAAGSGGTAPNGIISTGQGFGVKVMSAGGPVDVTFNNAMRRTSGNTTLRNQDRDRIWLNVQSEGYELNGTALIGFLPEATAGFDVGFDAERLATNVSLYSHLDDGSNMFGIQARGAFEENMKIPMGFATLVDEKLNYTISIENIEGVNLESATAYLIDTYEDVVTNLSESNYTFISEKGIYDNRFVLQFTPEGILGTNEISLETVSLYPNPTRNKVTIVSPELLVTSATVYDIRGRKVSEVDFSNQTNYQIDLSSLESAVYFIEITTENGTVNKQVIKEY